MTPRSDSWWNVLLLGVLLGGSLFIAATRVRAVQSFFHDYELTFPALLDADGAVSRAYAVYALPSSFLIDRQGKLRMVYRGPLPRTILAGAVELLLPEER